MLDFLEKYLPNKDNLTEILKPIQNDLDLLEVDLLKTLASGNKKLDEVVKYVFNSGGKRLRPAIVILFGRALNKGFLSSNHFNLALAIEMIHTASLVHDDVIDDADTRRGLMTVGKKWNAKTAVITGDFILSRALTKLVQAGNSATEIFAGTLNELCIGEIQQSDSKYKAVSIEDYIKKSERKTAMLFAAGAETAAIITPGVDNAVIGSARKFATNFGIAFQIVDDVMNFSQVVNKSGKPAGNDLKNGILTAPVLYALQEYSEKGDNTLKKLINTKFEKDSDFNKAMDLILNSDGFIKTKQLVEKYTNLAIESLNYFEDNSCKRIMIELALYNMNRTS